jgi:hypothetical protein
MNEQDKLPVDAPERGSSASPVDAEDVAAGAETASEREAMRQSEDEAAEELKASEEGPTETPAVEAVGATLDQSRDETDAADKAVLAESRKAYPARLRCGRSGGGSGVWVLPLD